MKAIKGFLAWLIMAGLALSACAPAATAPTAAPTVGATGTVAATVQSQPDLKIGLLTDLSGRFVTFGKDIQAATNLATDKINAEGGINGSKLVIELVDTGGQPDQAVIGLRDLVNNQGVFAVSGPLSSGEAEVVFAQAAALKVPVMSGTANKEGITQLGKGWAFRNTATNTALYTVAMPAWQKAFGVKTAVLVYDEAEPVSTAAAKFAIPAVAAKVGLQIVNADAPVTFTGGQTDFSTTVQRIKATPADGLIILSTPTEAGLIARELSRQGETRPVLGHPAEASATFFSQGGAKINNWVLPSIFNSSSTDAATQTYLAAMATAKPGAAPVPEAANYYDNILMLAKVMRGAGLNGSSSPEAARETIRAALLALSNFAGVAGQTTFGGNADADKTVYVNVVMAGLVQPLR